jgi:hypothetical protein
MEGDNQLSAIEKSIVELLHLVAPEVGLGWERGYSEGLDAAYRQVLREIRWLREKEAKEQENTRKS